MESSETPSKRARISDGAEYAPESRATPPAPFTGFERLPVELLAEVLSHLPSPKDLLAVARTNKHLCATLLNPSNAHCWVTARKNCNVGLVPAPPPGWSEPAHASFVFDGGVCEECKRMTGRMLASYAIGARLCGNKACRRTFYQNKISPDRRSIAGRLERKNLGLSYVEDPRVLCGTLFQPFDICYYRKFQYEELDDHLARIPAPPTNYVTNLELHKKKQRHFVQLAEFRNLHEGLCDSVAAHNSTILDKFAKKLNWKVDDLRSVTAVATMMKQANCCLEKVTMEDLDRKTELFKEQLVVIMTNREQRQIESEGQKRRDDVKHHFNYIVSHPTALNKNLALPSLSKFRALPIATHLSGKSAPTILQDLVEDSHSSPSMLENDIRQWNQQRRLEFQRLLGAEGWRDPNPLVLDPIERLNACFLCVRCNSVPMKRQERGSFDFASACVHECPGLKKKKRKKAFSINHFVVDFKGKAAIERAAQITGVDLSLAGAKSKLDAFGVRFHCKSCEGHIVMPFSRVSGHAARHDSMELELLSSRDATAMLKGAPYEQDATLQYRQRKLGNKSYKVQRQAKIFLCRYCHDSTIPREASTKQKSGLQAMTIDGFVSHAKALHNILTPGDEDFFHVPEAGATAA